MEDDLQEYREIVKFFDIIGDIFAHYDIRIFSLHGLLTKKREEADSKKEIEVESFLK